MAVRGNILFLFESIYLSNTETYCLRFCRYLLDFRIFSCRFATFMYSGLNLNQYGVASPCRTICTVCGFVALS